MSSKLPEFVESAELARLIPVVADSNKEQRLTSIVLAAMHSVYDFRQAMLGTLGVRVGKRANLHAWTEVTFRDSGKGKDKQSRKDRPDGLLILDTGKKQWRALVEAKVGNAEIDEEQLKAYVQQAKQHKLDAVITISNQFVAMPSHHPVKLPKNQIRGIELYHWSWMYILTQATLLLESDDMESDDQRFMLDEVTRFMSHDSSGISQFTSMNKEWKDVVGKVKCDASLSRTSEEVENTVSSWHQEQRDLCLIMSRKLGQTASLRLSRSHRTDPQQRLKDDTDRLVKEKQLGCTLVVPNAAADLEVTADLSRRTIVCSMRLPAPQDRKSTKARVNWLTRQLGDIEAQGIHIKAVRSGKAPDTQVSLEEARNHPESLESEGANSVPRAFEVLYVVDLAGSFSGSKKFIEALEQAVPHFYEQAGQRLRAWVAPPPRIRSADPAAEDEPVEQGGDLPE